MRKTRCGGGEPAAPERAKPDHDREPHPERRAAFQDHERRRGRRADPRRGARRHVRIHRRRLSQGRAARAGGPHEGASTPRASVSRSASGPAPRPRPNSTAPSPGPTASSCACPTSPTRTAAKRINAGELDYIDIHLSHVAQFVWFGFFGKLDVAVVEVAGVRPDGRLIPSSSVGNNKTWLDQADKIILEVNSWQNPALEGMHDIYYGTDLPPHRASDPADHGARPHRPAVFLVRPGQGDRRRRDQLGRPQLGLRAARPRLARHRRQHPRLPCPRGEEGPAAAGTAALAVGRRQRRERRHGRAPARAVRGPLLLHRGAAGRHAEPDQVGQDGVRLGDRAVAVAGGRGGVQPRRRRSTARRWSSGRRRSAITPS